MIARSEGPTSPALLDVRRELGRKDGVLARWTVRTFRFALHRGARGLWIVVDADGAQTIALRAAHVATGSIAVGHLEKRPDGASIELSTDVGAFRVVVDTRTDGRLTTLHSVTTLIPSHDLRLASQPRDLIAIETQGVTPQRSGRLYTRQHGSQTGSLFAACSGTRGASLFYLQNFTSLAAYFEDTKTTPKDSVGGTWPEIGFALPTSEEHPLLASDEYTLSDAYLVLGPKAPKDDGEVARAYLDALAAVVARMADRPRSYRDWPKRALATVYDLSLSPECTIEARGRRYLAPYVNTKNKPPESMVQLTVLIALLEFERWLGRTFALSREITEGLPSFFREDLGTVVRWLPGERFDEKEDEHQNHVAMDSWYLYHVLFNLTRLAALGRADARAMLERSLPYAIRVAKRFAYRWPIFFDLTTLDVIQSEASKGSGGENDVAGLYALVMLHAHDLFGDRTYLDEARLATEAMEGLGFGLSYQTNTTGFAAEAAVRLWKKTGDARYYDLTLIALANVFDNMALWESRYGNARHYSTYFGLYPLRGAPYIAAYEELEALAKFHELLAMAGDELPKSVTLLVSEFAKWLVSRGWSYYPGELPAEALAPKPRNGAVRRELAIPLEDLQDGSLQSGQVGQEIYGAGLALVCTTRHFVRIPGRPFLVFCEYPLQSVARNRYRVAGDPRMTCTVRLIPTGADARVPLDAVGVRGSKRAKPVRSVEGHVRFEVRGGDELTIRAARSAAKT